MSCGTPTIGLPVARRLPPDEWDRLRDVGPFKTTGVLPDPRFAMVVVLEDPVTQAIVGCWEVTTLALLEGLHLDPAWRHHPAAARRLFFEMLSLLAEYRIKTALTVIQDESVRVLARKAGFTDLPGTLHLLTRKD